jgi:hypothetical protein
MPETIETTVFTYNELSESAKNRARDWFYQAGALHHDWFDSVYEDAKAVGALMGITIDKIYFTGFASQGDGACFEGSYEYAKGAVKAIADYAPQDETLPRIAKALQETQRKAFYRLSAKVYHSGHYYHSRCTSIHVFNQSDWAESEIDESISESLRDFMDWIYNQLERDHDYLSSQEVVEETIVANGYTFTADGARFG